MSRPTGPRTAALLVGLLLGTSVASLTGGSAASLRILAADLGAGSVRLVCDDDLDHRFMTAPADPSTITAVRIWKIEMPECRGHDLAWAVITQDGEVHDSGTAIVTSSSIWIELIAPIAAADIGTVEAVVVGTPSHPGQGNNPGPSPVFVVHLR